MLKRLGVCLLLLTTCLMAQASDYKWVNCYQDDKVKVYFYTKIIKRGFGYRVWVKYDYSQILTYEGEKFSYAMTFYEYSDSFETYKFLDLYLYDDSDNSVYEESFEGELPRKIVPGTLDCEIAEAVEEWLKANKR